MKTSLRVSVLHAGAVVAAAAFLVPIAARAVNSADDKERTNVQISVDTIRSDNVERVPANGASGTIWSAGTTLDIARQSRMLTLLVRGDLDWMKYPDDIFGSDLLGEMDASAVVAFVPDVFTWGFQETYGQLRVSPFSTVTPDNLEDISYFSTGPDLTLRVGGATSVRLAGRFSRTDSGLEQLEGERYRAEAAFIRSLSQARSLSLQAAGERFEYASAPPSAEFDRHEVFARYQVRGARTDIGADLGYTALDMDTGTSDGVLARLSVSRRISSAATLQLVLGNQFSSAGDLFRGGLEQQNPLSQPGSVLGTADPFESRSVSLRWDFKRNRTSLGLGSEHSEEMHESAVVLDRERTAWNAYFIRRMSRKLSLRADARFVDESYESGFDSEETQLGASLNWMAGRKIDLSLGYVRFDRDSSLALNEYTENRVSLTAVWFPLKRP